MLFLIFGFFFLLSWVVGNRLKRKFQEYSQVATSSGMSGKEIAEKMLRDNDIHDVRVISVDGQLTDHYNPMDKTVNLSPDVYHGRHVSAAAVSAHEVGHAVQHAHAYSWLQLRSTLVPIQNVSGKILNFIMIASFIGGYFLYSIFPVNSILILIISCYAVLTTFSLITLPVEFDASRRGLAWMTNAGILRGTESDKAKDALKWAASTYVVAALGSLVTLLYYVMIFMGRRDD